MVDSRDKGARAETAVRDELRKATGLKWERVPGSGALDEKHGLKGDLYVPGEKNLYCVEVKHYAEDHLTSELLTGKSPILLDWWAQAVRQAKQVDKKPLLIFKHDRSKLFVAHNDIPVNTYRVLYACVAEYNISISLLSDWLNLDNPQFIK
jgi:hypothetical protein